MKKRSRRRKHIPQRTCVACRATRPKRELVRIVRTPDGAVIVDETGKRSGRGAYLCRQRVCWEKALARGAVARALKVPLTAEAKALLQEYAAGLPRFLATRSEGSAGDHDVRMKEVRGDE